MKDERRTWPGEALDRLVSGRPLLRAFRDDRALALATLVMAALSLAPLTATSILPFSDLPHHAALSGLLWDVAFGRGDAAAHYSIDPLPMPYWTLYLALAPLVRALGVFTGTKVMVALCALAVPLGAMRLLLALGRSPRIGLWAFLLVWDYSLCFGWLNHVLGAGIALFALARVLEADSPRAAVRAWPAGVVLALTHVLPFGFFGLAAALTALVRPGPRRRAIAITAVALAAPALVLVPWLVRSFRSAAPGPDAGLHFDPLGVKVTSLFTFTLGGGLTSDGALHAAGAAFVLLLVGPLGLFLMKQEAPRRSLALAAVPVVTALVLYLTLPLSVERPVEHWGTYPRFATLLVLGLWMLPSPRLTGARAALALAPAFAACAWLSRETFVELATLDVALAPFHEIAGRVPGGASLLPLCYDTTFPMARRPLGESLHAYITARTGGYNPYLFGQPTNPVHYVEHAKLPAPPAWGRWPELFSMYRHGRHYDFILVLGRVDDPVPPEGAALMHEVDRYKLYSVQRDAE